MNVFSKAAELWKVGKPFVLVTMVSGRGHTPQDSGAKMIVTSDGLFFGTVGGGKVEAKAILKSKEMISNQGTIESLTWNLQRDVGMSCGGEVSFLFEGVFPQSWKIAIFGAGHVGQMLIRQCSMLDASVFCIDNRPEWIERAPKDVPNLKCILATELAAEVARFNLDTYFVITTKGHDSDLPVIRRILDLGIPKYLGVIGSDVKALRIRKELKEFGYSDEAIQKVDCPMGIDIGNSNSPAEIAFSITAKLIQVHSLSR